MHGAIAAGHPLTAEAGADILEAGGNAVDACLAAAFVSWVTESPLTGPGGGGFMLVHTARDSVTRVYDFFVTIPGRDLGRTALRSEMDEIDVDFSGGATQVFHIGPASCAVPGAVAGLHAVHRAHATLPWPDLLAPAIDLARDGVEITAAQAYLHAILDVILRARPEGREIFGADGKRLGAGDRIVMPDLARTLEILATDGARALYDGPLGEAVVEHVRAGGGVITPGDLREYRVMRRRPVRVAFDGHDVRSNPPPSTGGILIGYGLKLLDALPPRPAGSAEAMAELIEVMREQARVRSDARFTADLYRGGLTRRLYAQAAIRAALRRIGRAPAVPEPRAPRGTTHISTVDRLGNAAALTISTGSGSGVVVPGTGIHLNNMLGEFDLNITGASRGVGLRLTSMMAPTLVLHAGAPRAVVGSAGSLRLRGAIMQVVVNVVRHRMPVEDAIAYPRVHADEEHVHVEGGAEAAEVERLAELGYDVVRWRRRNLFFGGVAAVELAPDGSLHAAGDPRRGGHGVVV